MSRRGYYRIPKKAPANRVDGALAEAVLAKYGDGWPKSRIAREFRLNRRTVIRICAPPVQVSPVPLLQPEPPDAAPASEPAPDPLINCIGCGIEIPIRGLREHWACCPRNPIWAP